MSAFDDGRYASGEAEIAREQRDEFIADTAENMRSLDVALEATRHGHKTSEELIHDLMRLALPLSGQAAHFGARLLGFVAHRLQDYLTGIRVLPPRFLDDVQAFIEVMEDIVEGNIAPDSDPSEIVRRLPAKSSFEVGDIEVRNIEILLVMLHGAQTHFVEREMQQCGYRVTVVTSTFNALPMAVRTKPDMIIVSALMPELDGVDLAVALSAMPSTRNIPLALITSLDKDDHQLQFLPKHIPIIRKGAKFGDDLANALDSCFLL